LASGRGVGVKERVEEWLGKEIGFIETGMGLDDGFVAFSDDTLDTGLVTDTLGGIGEEVDGRVLFKFKFKAFLLAFAAKPSVESLEGADGSGGKTACDANTETGRATL